VRALLQHLVECAFFFGLLIAATIILGTIIASCFNGEQKTPLYPVLGWLENLCYRIAGVDPKKEMNWVEYTKTLLLFNFWCFVALFLILVFQKMLPLNPQGFDGVDPALAFNTAASFVTNTNWQAYSGETTLSYFSQMVGLASQNFLSAAIGLTSLLALIRGIKRKNSETIGNFWEDLVRSIVYILLPLSIILAFVLVGQGVVQTFSPYVEATTIEGAKQVIPLGPAASQIAIKQLGTNGGGFFGTNSAHPFENPTPLSNFIELFAVLLIPAALVYAYGISTSNKRHGVLLFLVMFFLLIVGIAGADYSERLANPVIGAGPILEGKELRFGTPDSVLWAVSTTATANGSNNCMHSSLSPLAGGVALFNMMVGEVIFGGIGVGLAGMLMFVLLTVFLSGLMVGRTPEYLGKKIEKRDIQWVIVSILTPGALILIGTALSCVLPVALKSLCNLGPHGFSEMLYAFTSSAANNGSSFAGLDANTPFYNISLGITMLLGRLAIIVPSLAVAGGLAAKRSSPPSAGTFSVDTFLFAIILLGVILIVGALTFFPALALGPIVEHFLMLQGRAF
jgi:K+-transporting ATPase ATPase A chain